MTPTETSEGHDGRCGAKKKQGHGHCGQAAGWGTNHPGTGRCKLHGGKTTSHNTAAAQQYAHAEASRMVARDGVDRDPYEHLLDCLHLAAQLVVVYGAMVAAIDERAEEELDEGQIRGELGYDEVESDKGFTDLIITPKDRMMAVNAKGESKVHPYVTEYQHALERRAKFAKLCIDAGIAERLVTVTEQQADIVQRAFEEALQQMKLPKPKQQEFRRVYASRLRAQSSRRPAHA